MKNKCLLCALDGWGTRSLRVAAQAAHIGATLQIDHRKAQRFVRSRNLKSVVQSRRWDHGPEALSPPESQHAFPARRRLNGGVLDVMQNTWKAQLPYLGETVVKGGVRYKKKQKKNQENMSLGIAPLQTHYILWRRYVWTLLRVRFRLPLVEAPAVLTQVVPDRGPAATHFLIASARLTTAAKQWWRVLNELLVPDLNLQLVVRADSRIREGETAHVSATTTPCAGTGARVAMDA